MNYWQIDDKYCFLLRAWHPHSLSSFSTTPRHTHTLHPPPLFHHFSCPSDQPPASRPTSRHHPPPFSLTPTDGGKPLPFLPVSAILETLSPVSLWLPLLQQPTPPATGQPAGASPLPQPPITGISLTGRHNDSASYSSLGFDWLGGKVKP